MKWYFIFSIVNHKQKVTTLRKIFKQAYATFFQPPFPVSPKGEKPLKEASPSPLGEGREGGKTTICKLFIYGSQLPF